MDMLNKRERHDAICDVHILTRPFVRPAQWLDQCLSSLEHEPVNWYLLEGRNGRLGLSRAEAFQHGNTAHASFVDDDDIVEPGAFAASVDALNACDCISQTYTDVWRMNRDATVTGLHSAPYSKARHLTHANAIWHLHTFRRAQLEQILPALREEATDEEFLMCGLMCRFGQPHHIPEPLYRWRRHDAGSHAGNRIKSADRSRTIKQVARTVMRAPEPCKHIT